MEKAKQSFEMNSFNQNMAFLARCLAVSSSAVEWSGRRVGKGALLRDVPTAAFGGHAFALPTLRRYLASIVRASAGVAALSPSSSMILTAFSTSAALLGASWPLPR